MKKIRPLGKDSFAKRILKALRNTSGFEFSTSSRENERSGVSGINVHYDFHKGLKNAMLEAEQTRAKTVMEYQMRNADR